MKWQKTQNNHFNNEGAKEYNGAKVDFSTNSTRTPGQQHAKEKNISRHRPYTLQKINLIWITTCM